MKQEFKPYWIIGSERLDDYETMRQRVLSGALAIEVGPERQRQEAELLERREKQAAIEAEERQRRLDQQEHQNSPVGQREAAVRFAQQHLGGIVSMAPSKDFAVLDEYAPPRTNELKL